jgi:flagellar motor switch protein FliN/FliY
MDRTQVHAVKVELSVLLGRSSLPMRQLLRMGRGAEIALDTKEHDELWILANNHPIARGEIMIRGDRLCITITRAADVNEFYAAV